MKVKVMELLNKQKFQIKIADLGFSKQLSSIDQLMNSYCGTPLTMAPEIMHGASYNYKADIWSVGGILFTLITGVFPFFAMTREKLLSDIDKGQYQITQQLTITPICLDFINRCLQYSPQTRIGWDEIEAHPFYNHQSYNKILQKITFALSFDNGSFKLIEIPKEGSKQVSKPIPHIMTV